MNCPKCEADMVEEEREGYWYAGEERIDYVEPVWFCENCEHEEPFETLDEDAEYEQWVAQSYNF